MPIFHWLKNSAKAWPALGGIRRNGHNDTNAAGGRALGLIYLICVLLVKNKF